MAKRPRSEANDTAAEVPPAQPTKTRRTSTPPVAAETIAARPEPAGPTDEDIRMRAYHRYLERGGGHGMDFEDWLEAERELRGTGKSRNQES